MATGSTLRLSGVALQCRYVSYCCSALLVAWLADAVLCCAVLCRVLGMVDGAVLLVDANEGPLSQTKVSPPACLP
jgi:hypothetical protein